MLQNKQWIFNFIALLILLTGMCVDEVRADSVFLCPQMSYIVADEMPEAVLTEAGAEPKELICTRTEITGSQIADYIANSRRTVKLSMIFLCMTVFSLLLSHFYTVARIVEFPELSIRTAVLRYIQNTDGKK